METITYNPYIKEKREFKYTKPESQWSSNYYGRPLIQRYDLVSLSDHMINKDVLDKVSYKNLMSSVEKAIVHNSDVKQNARDGKYKGAHGLSFFKYKPSYKSVVHIVLGLKTIENELWLEIACEVEGENALIPARWISDLWWTDNLKQRKSKINGTKDLTLAHTSIYSVHSEVWKDDYWKDQYVRPCNGKLAVRGYESKMLFTLDRSPINGWQDYYEQPEETVVCSKCGK